MASPTSDDKTRLFKKFLDDHGLDPQVFEFCTGTLLMSSVSDFSGYWTESEYGEGTKTDLLQKIPKWDHPSPDDMFKKVQLSRLRVAWQSASKLVQTAQPGSSGAAHLDLDHPLDQEEQKDNDDRFVNTYSLTLDPEDKPAKSMQGRFRREFTKRQQMSFFPLNKASSDAVPVTPARKEDKLSEKHTLVTALSSDPAPKHLNTVLDLLFAVQMLVHAMAIAGLDLVDSKTSAGKKVRQCSLTQAYWYRSFIWTHVRQHPRVQSQPTLVIKWVCERDRQTRLKAQQLFEQGWPFGEALQHVCETSMSVLWTVGNEAGASSPVPVVQLATQEEKGRLADRPPKRDMSQVALCTDWNASRCTIKQKDCPHELRHACNFKAPGSNKECGDWRHKATDCPLRSGGTKRRAPTPKGGDKANKR